MQAIIRSTPKPDIVVGQQGKPSVRVFVDGDKSTTLQIPQSHDDMMALLEQRRVLSDQLDQATDRRDELMRKMLGAPEPAQAGLKAQLNVLNDRIVQLEGSLNTIGQEIAGASPSLMSMADGMSHNTDGSFDDGMTAGAFAAGLPVLAIMTGVLLIMRKRWKKKAQRPAPMLPSADSERLQRLEHGIEAMAIEIERISEGQRFVTKLLADSKGYESAPR